MAYIAPNVQVYQQLESGGGVINATPDLRACIIGPAYNVINYVAGSVNSMIQTAAESTVSASGATTEGSDTITFDTVHPFRVGDSVLVLEAAVNGGTLTAQVLDTTPYTIVLNTQMGVTLESTLVRKTGSLEDTSISNTFSLPSQKPGQQVRTDSVQVYLNNARVETLASKFTGFAGLSSLAIVTTTGTGSTTSGSPTVTGVTNAAFLTIGDIVGVAGAGVGGVELVGKVINIVGSTVTLDVSAGTTVATGDLVKKPFANIDPATATLLVESGDTAQFTYENTSGETVTMDVTISGVSDLSGNITTLNISDLLPDDFSVRTTAASVTAGVDSITVASAADIIVGDTLLIRGAGVDGADLVTIVGGIDGDTLEDLAPAPASAVVNATVIVQNTATVSIRKLFNNQLLPITNPIGGTNYSAASAATAGEITINPNPYLVYGRVVSGDVHIAYRALRQDLSGSVGEIINPDDLEGVLGEVSDENPLALGVQIALANTTTSVNFIAIESDDDAGYIDGLDLAEGQRLYALAPLTQSESVIAAVKAHVEQLSSPEEGLWRAGLVNTRIPTHTPVGPYSEDFVNVNGGNNVISLINGFYVLTASNATFLSDGLVPGDTIHITAGTGSPDPIGTWQVQNVINNQQVVLNTQGGATAVSYYATRTLSKAQQAQAVASVSRTLRSRRMIHIQPDTVGVQVNGVTKYLPGYYLCAGIAGATAGQPVQQGFTNMTIAGITDLKNSNLYFTRAQMGVMAEEGTWLVVQETQGSIPYTRHELTTDVSVLEYREYLITKNWDSLSYIYRDRLTPFIGHYNITPDTLNTMRSVIDATTALLVGQKLPRIGPPLLSGRIMEIAQDQNNKDRVRVRLRAEVVYPLNYVDLYIII